MELLRIDWTAAGGAAAIALAGAALFGLLAGSWCTLARTGSRAGYFAEYIAPEAGQRFRRAHDNATNVQAVLLSSGLVFLLAFAAAYLLLPPGAFAGLAAWQLVSLAALLLAAALLIGFRIAKNFVHLRRLRYQRDAHIAIGHCLQRLVGNMKRVFHDVQTAKGIVDNVVVGLHGVYAIHVVALRPRRNGRVVLSGEQLGFAPGKASVTVADCLLKSAQLAREIREALSLHVRVRTVVAVPGWQIGNQSGDQCLIVNERNLVMLGGWREPEDYLMNEDVESLHDLLDVMCARPVKAVAGATPAGRARALR